MSRQRYLTALQLASLQGAMTANGWAVLRDVATMRLATASDLQTLQALRAPVPVRSFRGLLRRLDDQGVLFRLDRTVGGRKAGSAGFVYGVGLAGQRLLGERPRRLWTPRPSWLAHALASSHLYVSLRQAEAQRSLALERFEAEPICWRSFTLPGGGTIAVKPDAFVRLDVGEFTDSFFVELDMGTESPATLARKADVYADYRTAGIEQTEHGVFPWVLWLVPDEQRAAVVHTVIDRQGEAAQLHRVATQAQALAAFLSEPP